MDKYEILITKPAENDLREISRYIADELMEPDTARRFLKRLSEKIMSLETMPNRYAVVNDEYLKFKGYRLICADRHLIFYRTDDELKRVYITRVLNERREWSDILK